MYNRTQISEQLIGLVGFQNPINPSYKFQPFSEEAPSSRSGRYFTDNPYCKVEFIRDCQDYADVTIEEFNVLLEKIQRTAIMNVCDAVFNNNDFLERELVYPYPQNKQETEVIPTGFIGFRIIKKANKALKINKVISEFANTGTYTLMCFNVKKPNAIYTQLIEVADIGYQETLLNWVLNDTNLTQYIIGYANTGQVGYKKEYNYASVYAYFHNINIDKVNSPDYTGGSLFDLRTIKGISETPGINLDITVYKDYTDQILNNEMLFSTALQIAGQIDVMKLILSSLRSNFTERITKEVRDKMMFEIEGNPEMKIYGLKYHYEKEIIKLRDSFKIGLYYKNRALQ